LLLDGWNELECIPRNRLRVEIAALQRDYPALRTAPAFLTLNGPPE
jgi:hypothetical protein